MVLAGRSSNLMAHQDRLADPIDFGFHPSDLTPTDLIGFLDRRIERVLVEFEKS